MNGRELKHLAAVADLAKLDFEAAGLTLSCYGGELMSIYTGAYSAGWRSVKDDTVPNFQLVLWAERFKAISALFRDNDEVRIVPTERGLDIRSSSARASLQERHGDPSVPSDVIPPDGIKDPQFEAVMPASEMLDEFESAASFVSDTNIRPILRGIKLQANKRAMMFTAFDGFYVLYTSLVKTKIKGSADITIPSADFMLGMQLVASLGGDSAMLQPRDSEMIVIANHDQSAVFRCALLRGAWPATESITEAPIVGSPITLSAEQVKTIVASGKAYAAAEVIFEPLTSNRARLIVSDNETGRYAMTVKGSLDARVVYDLASLSKVAALGQSLSMTIPSTPDFPTFIESGERRCWVVTRG